MLELRARLAATALTAGCLFWGTAAAQGQQIVYDDFETSADATPGYDLDDYNAKWSYPFLAFFGVGEPTLPVAFDAGRLDLDPRPITWANDSIPTIYHIKYIVISNQELEVPVNGSIMFSADIVAQTPNTLPGVEMRAHDRITGDPVVYNLLEGRQALTSLHMLNLTTSDPGETGQLFDWLVSENKALALTERLFNFGAQPATAGQAYTQIIAEIPLEAGSTHNFAIRYQRKPGEPKDRVEFLIDGKVVATHKDVGVPLDDQHPNFYAKFPITDPSDPSGEGEILKPRINRLKMAHGLFSLLDVWPYGEPQAGGKGVTIPVGGPAAGIKTDHVTGEPYVDTRIWGQGAQGYHDNFTVTIEGQ